jgi:hypothetical protein
MNAPFGHNETAVRLGLLADDARSALAIVAKGEDDALAGWLAYGAALNEGRAQFHPEDDKGFGEWVEKNLLHQVGTVEIRREERAAAMWAAREPEQYQMAKAAGDARTVRGIYAKWHEINAEAEAAKARAEAEAERAIAEAERAKAEAARAQADAERAEAAARAKAEADALKAAQKAKDDEARKAAQAIAAAEAEAKAEAERRAKAAEAEAKAANKIAKAADKSAKKSDSKAKKADKRAASAKTGAAATDKTAHVSNNGGNNEWYTPPAFVEAARAVLGSFDLDPASSEIANRTVQAARIFTAEDDGLAQEWPIGTIWMNPPYAQPLIGQFAKRFAEEIERGSVGVALVNNATETGWFQFLAARSSAICFPKSRVKFLDTDGDPGSPLQGQAIIYCGPNPDAFEAAFSGFGLVVRHG